MGLVYARPNAPCKDCKERHVGCHAECERYKEFAEENRRRHDEACKAYVIEQGLEAAEIIRQTRNKRT
jgi:hypothetical protein